MNIKSVFKFGLLVLALGYLLSCNSSRTGDNATEPADFDVEYLTVKDSSGLLMKESDFWKIIEASRVEANYEYQAQIEILEKLLTKLNPVEIEKFDNTFRALMAASYDSKLWGASYVINGGCSDDCFEYFREYLIAHGKYKFYTTLKDPESCAPWIKSESEDNWEGIAYSASNSYKQLTGKELPYSYQPNYELKGKIFNEDTVDEQYPILAERF